MMSAKNTRNETDCETNFTNGVRRISPTCEVKQDRKLIRKQIFNIFNEVTTFTDSDVKANIQYFQ